MKSNIHLNFGYHEVVTWLIGMSVMLGGCQVEVRQPSSLVSPSPNPTPSTSIITIPSAPPSAPPNAQNLPPAVLAGSGQTITLPATAQLRGSAADDGKPLALTFAWTKQSGPGTVSFSAATSLATNVTFSAAGTYVLQLEAFDGALRSASTLGVTVLAAAPAPSPSPTVSITPSPVPTNAGTGEKHYLSQSGTGTGSSCSSARSVSWFNTKANWISAEAVDGKIGPNDVIYLCGTITSSLTLQGSGVSGKYITIDGTGATFSGGFSTSNQSWWKIQNVAWSNGSSRMITITGGSNGIFTGNRADDGTGNIFIAQGTTLSDKITISNNYIRSTAANLGNSQFDIIATEGSTNVVIEGNYLELRAGGSGSQAHDDVIQTWESGSSTSKGGPSNWTIRYNRIVMNSAATNDRSWTMLENLSGTNNIYGNMFLGLQGASEANGLCINSSRSGAVFNISNNTFVSKGSASNNVLNLANSGTANVTNNIFYTNSQTILTGDMSVSRKNNLWYGTNAPSCGSEPGCIRNQDPKFVDYANNQFGLVLTSPAIRTGIALSGADLARGVACNASWPAPAMLTRTSWSMGAFVCE